MAGVTGQLWVEERKSGRIEAEEQFSWISVGLLGKFVKCRLKGGHRIGGSFL
jgi:hypothetical protein